MPKAKSRPNILWICTDSQRYDTLAVTGNKLIDTPYRTLKAELEKKTAAQKLKHKNDKFGYKGGKDDAEHHRTVKAAYYGMIDLIDKQVGRLVDALKESGQLENTLIIFTSDHGEMLGDHGIYTKGPYLYDPALQVPLILSMPGVIPQNKHSDAFVELGDLAPTVLECAGIKKQPGMQAKSFWKSVISKKPFKSFRKNVYCEYYNSNPDKKPLHMTMLRDNHYKIIRTHGDSISELYDLKKDPEERYNRWSDPEYEKVKSKYLCALSDRMAYTSDPLPERVGIF